MYELYIAREKWNCLPTTSKDKLTLSYFSNMRNWGAWLQCIHRPGLFKNSSSTDEKSTSFSAKILDSFSKQQSNSIQFCR